MSKPWWTSKTIIASIVVALVGCAATIANAVTGSEILNIETQASVTAIIVAALMFVLRFVTKQPIE